MIFIKKLPLALSGLMLSCFALANLIKPLSPYSYQGLSVLGLFLFFFISLKIILNFKGVLEDLKHPVIASVLPTYTMSIMLLAAFLKPALGMMSLYIWYGGIILHSFLIINYLIRFLINFDIKKIFPSIFVVFVGIVVASISAPVFNKLILGQYAFYFGLTAYILTFLLVLIRLLKFKILPVPAQPTFAIMAAPASLLLAGYLTTFSSVHTITASILLAMSLLMYLLVIIKLPKLLSLKFSPGFAAYTFPLVISGISIKKASLFFNSVLLKPLAVIQLIIATLMVLYVLIQFIKFFIIKADPQVIISKQNIS